ELADALTHWTVDSYGVVNAFGARAMVEGYRAEAGRLPRLDLTAFSGAATSFGNYAAGEIRRALDARGGEDSRHADRSVRHLLASLPTRATLERLLDAAATAPSWSRVGGRPARRPDPHRTGLAVVSVAPRSRWRARASPKASAGRRPVGRGHKRGNAGRCGQRRPSGGGGWGVQRP